MESYAQDGSTFGAPPIMNSQPQMFGDYGSDDPVQFSGNYFDGDGQGNVDENGDPKRRRIARVLLTPSSCSDFGVDRCI